MYRKLLLALAGGILSCGALQAQTYTFSQSTGTYAPLTGGTNLTGGMAWDDTAYTVPMPFPIMIGNRTYTSGLNVDSNGLIYFDTQPDWRYGVAYNADLIDRGTGASASPIRYQVTGSAGSRILKIEWSNVGFYSGAASDVANAQLWLYEGSNRIESHIGPSTIGNISDAFDGETGPAIGVVYDENASNNTISAYFLTGAPGAASAQNVQGVANPVYLGGVPADGTIYAFTPGTVSAPGQVQAQALQVYPNPASGQVRLNGLRAAAQVQVYNALGQQVRSLTLAPDQNLLDLQPLQAGTYFVVVQHLGQRQTLTVVKE